MTKEQEQNFIYAAMIAMEYYKDVHSVELWFRLENPALHGLSPFQSLLWRPNYTIGMLDQELKLMERK